MRLLLIILGGIMATLALIMLVVGCLATGSTRHSVYRAWKARVGGRLSCAIVMTSWYMPSSDPNVLYLSSFLECLTSYFMSGLAFWCA